MRGLLSNRSEVWLMVREPSIEETIGLLQLLSSYIHHPSVGLLLIQKRHCTFSIQHHIGAGQFLSLSTMHMLIS